MSSLKKDIVSVLEQLTEEATTQMMNMSLDPVLTKDLILNAEERAVSQILKLIEEALPEEKDSKNFQSVLTGPSIFPAYWRGWNAALKDIKSKLIEGEEV